MSFKDVKACGAKRRDGGRCQQPAMRPSGRCRLHGGATPRGLAHPRTITGRYSRDLPTRMLDRYRAALSDRELLSVKQEIAFVTAAIGQTMSELEAADRSVDWEAVNERVQAAIADGRTWDRTRAEREWQALGELLVGRRDEATIMREIRDLIDQRARLVLREARLLRQRQQTMTLEEAILLAQTLTGIVRKHVPDPAVLERIGREWAQVIELSPDAVEAVDSGRS